MRYQIFQQYQEMDDDSSWDIEPETEPTSSPSSAKRTTTPAVKEPEEEPWDDEPDETEVKNELQESNWMQEIKKEEKRPSRRQETSFNQNTSFLQGADNIVGEEKELNPVEANTTFNWSESEDNKKTEERPRGRGNRDYNNNKEEEPPKRGNRPRNNEGDQEFGKNRGNRSRNQDDNRDEPRRGNRGNREGQEQSRRGNRGFREMDEGNEPPRRGNREGGGNFRKKQGFQTSQGGQYQRGGGGYRGRGRGRGGYRGGGGGGNYDNRDSNNNYRGNNSRSQLYREKTNFQQDRPERTFQYQERDYNSYNNYRPPPARTFEPPVFEPPPFSAPPLQVAPAKKDAGDTLSETQKMVPKGRKCWPQSSLNILNCKFVVTARQLSDFRCKMLVMPYSTLQMEYFPGNVINSSSVDYRKKIMNKGSEIQAPGSIYLQKAIEVFTFQAICFVKIDKNSAEQSLKKGIHEMLKLVEKIEKPITLQSLVFPLCEELGNPSWVVSPFLSHLQNCRKVKQVYITTIQGSCYVKAAAAFNSSLEKMFKGNEIFLNI